MTRTLKLRRRLGAAIVASALVTQPFTLRESAAQGGGRRQAVQTESAQAERGRLEQQFRQRMAAIVQQRLRLTNAQMARLQQTNRGYEGRRRELGRVVARNGEPDVHACRHRDRVGADRRPARSVP